VQIAARLPTPGLSPVRRPACARGVRGCCDTSPQVPWTGQPGRTTGLERLGFFGDARRPRPPPRRAAPGRRSKGRRPASVAPARARARSPPRESRVIRRPAGRHPTPPPRVIVVRHAPAPTTSRAAARAGAGLARGRRDSRPPPPSLRRPHPEAGSFRAGAAARGLTVAGGAAVVAAARGLGWRQGRRRIGCSTTAGAGPSGGTWLPPIDDPARTGPARNGTERNGTDRPLVGRGTARPARGPMARHLPAPPTRAAAAWGGGALVRWSLRASPPARQPCPRGLRPSRSLSCISDD
jgi:hypothetical protein